VAVGSAPEAMAAASQSRQMASPIVCKTLFISFFLFKKKKWSYAVARTRNRETRATPSELRGCAVTPASHTRACTRAHMRTCAHTHMYGPRVTA